MNKTLLTTFAVLFSFVVFLNCINLAAADLAVLDHTTSLTIYQSSSASGYFVLNNTGNDTVYDITYSASNLPSGVSISYSPIKISPLAPATTARVDYNLTATSEADLGDKTATMNIVSSSYSTSFTLDINVKQRFCKLGIKGSHVTLNLDNPDSGDDFYPANNISVEFSVETNDDIDFTVEAELFDLTDQETVSDDSLDDNLDNEEQDYTLYLKVPSDINEGHDYIVRVKAYEDDKEDTQCDESSVSIDIKRNTHELTIDKVTYPGGLTCNQPYTINVKIENTGKKDETDVTVSISSSSLGIDQELTKDIDKGESATYYFAGSMPVVAPGKYSLRVDVTSDSGDADTSDLYTLNLQTGCKAITKDASISIVPGQYYFNQENTIIITLTNIGDVSTTYSLNASSIPWASIISIQPATITLNSGESGSIYITFNPNSNAAPMNSLPLTIKADGLIKTQILQVQLQNKASGSESAYESFLSTIKNNSWLFIMNVVLLIIIIVLIILVATRGSRRSREESEPKEARLKSNKKGKK